MAQNVPTDELLAALYPLKGVVYSVSNPSMLRSVLPIALNILFAAIAITAAMFFFLFIPHLAICAILGPFAFAAATTMIIGEAYFVVIFFCKTFYLSRAQEQLFNAVFRQQGIPLVYVDQRNRSRGFLQEAVKMLSKPFSRFSRDGLLRYIVSLPLNFIPVIGTILFLLYNGAKSGPTYHARYFQALGMTPAARQAFVERRKGAYTAFGAATLALALLPVIGPLSILTSTVGAALWACDLEQARSLDMKKSS
ncbi:hypothetical protein MKEN_01177500 [Mycena kentingensis (nom. inval.)]|nr:hypothetical protein MKEN_01177500 [Mycena kentingensis (nom. inval.)]